MSNRMQKGSGQAYFWPPPGQICLSRAVLNRMELQHYLNENRIQNGTHGWIDVYKEWFSSYVPLISSLGRFLRLRGVCLITWTTAFATKNSFCCTSQFIHDWTGDSRKFLNLGKFLKRGKYFINTISQPKQPMHQPNKIPSSNQLLAWITFVVAVCWCALECESGMLKSRPSRKIIALSW